MSKRVPIYALIQCVISTEMFALYQEMVIGESDESRTLWAQAGKVRQFIDQPRVKDHRSFLLAQIHQMRQARAQQGKPS